MTVGRYRDESIQPPFFVEPEELSVVAPVVPQQRRIDAVAVESGSVGLAGPPEIQGPTQAETIHPETYAGPVPGTGVRPEGRTYPGSPFPGSRLSAYPEPPSSLVGSADADPDVLGRTSPDGTLADAGATDDSASGNNAPDNSAPEDTERRPAAAGARHKPWPSPRQQIATGIMVLCTLAALFLLGHRFLPGSMGLLSLLESWLPWLAIPIAVLLLGAVAVRTPRALIAAAVAAAVWLAGYGPALLPRGGGLPAQLRVFSADVNGTSGELSRAGTLALAQHSDVVALEDVYGGLGSSPAAAKLNAAFPGDQHVTQYEFGVWSRYPIVNSTPIDLGTTTASADGQGAVAGAAAQQDFGALRVTIAAPQGDLVIYVVHIPQPVLNDNGFALVRDAAIKHLAAAVSADRASKLIVVGAVNVAATDREFSVLQQDLGLTSAQSAAGQGFGFTWPAEFPAVRLDDLLSRSGVTAVRSVVLPAIGTGKTHLPIEVDLNL